MNQDQEIRAVALELALTEDVQGFTWEQIFDRANNIYAYIKGRSEMAGHEPGTIVEVQNV